MRIVKDPEERRQEIIDTAKRLFITKGYEKTSINDILKSVGIAKGTFYYYFASKEDVLEAMVLEVVKQGAEKARTILQDESVPVLIRIIMALQAQAPEIEGADMLHEQMLKPENAKLDQVYLQVMVRELTEVLAKPVDEAIREGIMETDFPREGIGIGLLLTQQMLNRSVFDWSEGDEMRKIQVFLYYLQRILGIRKDAMQQLLMMLQSGNSAAADLNTAENSL